LKVTTFVEFQNFVLRHCQFKIFLQHFGLF
jgi:hypothetical protein